MLKDLVISKVRVKILDIFFSEPRQMYHVRELVRKTEEEINAVRRELEHLELGGILKKESRGNRLYYWLREDYPLYQDLLSMVAKETGLGAQFVKSRGKLGKVNLVMFSDRFARRQPRIDPTDVDVLVLGEIVLSELASLVRAEEARLEMEINYTVMTNEEFKFRRSRRDPFLQKILLGTRVMIIGDQEDLVG